MVSITTPNTLHKPMALAAIAAGMSAPFIILSAFPQWLRFLPKPGAWMERVKQGTGFLLLGTVVWLLWNFGENRQSTDALAWTGALLITVSVLLLNIIARIVLRKA